MATIFKKLLLLLLLVLFTMSFSYKGQTWQMEWSGLSAGTIILGIICVILLFKLKHLLKQSCVQRGIEISQASEYDVCFWIGLWITLFRGYWSGENLPGTPEGELAPKWSLAWSDNTWQWPFLLVLFFVIYSYKIFVMLNLILNDKEVR